MAELNWLSIHDAHAQLQSRQISSVELTQSCSAATGVGNTEHETEYEEEPGHVDGDLENGGHEDHGHSHN